VADIILKNGFDDDVSNSVAGALTPVHVKDRLEDKEDEDEDEDEDEEVQ
jgi:hypothetical protein